MVAVAAVGALSPAALELARRFERLVRDGRGFEVAAAYHPRGKDSYVEFKEILYDRLTVPRDGFLAVE